MAATSRRYRAPKKRAANPNGPEKGRARCPACRTWRYPDAWTWGATECDVCVEKTAKDLRALWAKKWAVVRPRGNPAHIGPAIGDVLANRKPVRLDHLPRKLREGRPRVKATKRAKKVDA